MRRIVAISLLLGAVTALSFVALELSPDGGPAEAVPGVADPVPHFVNNVLIDMDPYGTPANPANGLLGSIETCKVVPIGGSIDIDIVVDEIDPEDRIMGLNPTLGYAGAGPGAVNVTAVDEGLMIAANAGSDLLLLSDAAPDDGDGWFTIGAYDTGPLPDSAESGEGVLARVTLAGVGPVGMSWLSLSPFIVAATGPQPQQPLVIGNTEGAVVAVGDVNGDTAVDDLDCAGSDSDYDGDGIPDAVDNCFLIPNRWQDNEDGDRYGDVCDNCPAVATVWVVPPGDSDCDGLSDSSEAFVGTDPNEACGAGAWPFDFDDNQDVNILDVVQLTPPVYNSVTGDPLYTERKDLDPNGRIHILDIVKLTPPMFGQSCTP